MKLAKPGDIKYFCTINGLITFQEYLEDFASLETYQVGSKLIQNELSKLSTESRECVKAAMRALKAGQRDVFL
jgi:2-iminoacetate synthase